MSARRIQHLIFAICTALTMTLATFAHAEAQPNAESTINSITIAGKDDILLTLGSNQNVGTISISNRHRGIATVVWVPLPAFRELISALAELPLRVDALPVADAEQMVYGVPVALRQGVVGSILIGLTRRKGLPPEERGVLSVNLRRGDETWATRVELTGARIRPAVDKITAFFR